VSFPRRPGRKRSSIDPTAEPGVVPPGGDLPLHVASARDRTAEHSRDGLLGEILLLADARDAAAELRDRTAERRVPGDQAQSALDRVWAARDRDAAAVDRAGLIDALHQGAAAAQSRSRT
jgi:hypothetical protein